MASFLVGLVPLLKAGIFGSLIEKILERPALINQLQWLIVSSGWA
jgi:hypothetical protein